MVRRGILNPQLNSLLTSTRLANNCRTSCISSSGSVVYYALVF